MHWLDGIETGNLRALTAEGGVASIAEYRPTGRFYEAPVLIGRTRAVIPDIP